MKLAVTIAGEAALPSAFVVWRGFEKSISKAAGLGYHGVELALKSKADVDKSDLNRWLHKSGLEVSAISTGQVFADMGLYCTCPDAEKRDEIVDVFCGLIDVAKDFGGLINVGRARGFVAEGQSVLQAETLFIETFERILEEAARCGVTVILEPVNRYEINFINNLDEGAQLLNKIKHGNAGLMPDVFHMNIEDDLIGESLIRNAQHVKYLHFADSNRLAPGRGHLDFDEVFKALRQMRFDGWASVEILPKPDADTAAWEAVEFLLPKIANHNAFMLKDRGVL